MKAFMTWAVVAVFIIGTGVAVAAETDRCNYKSGTVGQKAATSAKKMKIGTFYFYVNDENRDILLFEAAETGASNYLHALCD